MMASLYYTIMLNISYGIMTNDTFIYTDREKNLKLAGKPPAAAASGRGARVF